MQATELEIKGSANLISLIAGAGGDIAAGEFTKVAQRVSIRIKLANSDLSGLKVGLGCEIEIKRSK